MPAPSLEAVRQAMEVVLALRSLPVNALIDGVLKQLKLEPTSANREDVADSIALWIGRGFRIITQGPDFGNIGLA